MPGSTTPRGRVAVIGAGPAGMATALSVTRPATRSCCSSGIRRPAPRATSSTCGRRRSGPCGLLGVDTEDLGAPCYTEFRSVGGRTRVRVTLPDDIVRDYGGGFIGLLRPGLYERLLAALPPGVLQVNRAVDGFDQDESGVRLHCRDGEVLEADVLVGADGIDSLVRRTLWGDAPKREHNLHIFGGFTFAQTVPPSRVCASSSTAGRCRAAGRRSATTAGTASSGGCSAPTTPDTPFTGRSARDGAAMAAEFAAPLPQLIAATDPADVQRWVLRDRKPLDQWSKGRATIVGDAAHPTSPYAAYGAGMATEDGYFLGRQLAGVDLRDHAAVRAALDAFETPRKPHTARQVQQAWMLGKIFHHAPAPLRPVRDAVLDHTPFLQKVVGERSPGEIIEQIAAIDEAERRFLAIRGSTS